MLGLVRTYQVDLEEFGILAFETRENRGTQGAPTEFAYLNEPQAALLMTYMRNSNIVRTFKKALVKAGVPMPYVAAQLGHTSTRMVEKHYGQLSAPAMAESIRKLTPALGITTPAKVAALKVKKKGA